MHCRLNKEVTAAREALATLKPVQGAATPMMTPSHPQQPPTPSHEQAVAAQQASATQEAAGMSADIVEKLQEKATVLTQERKRRGKTVPEELATVEQVGCHKYIFANTSHKYIFANTNKEVPNTHYKYIRAGEGVGGAFLPPWSPLCLGSRNPGS